MKLVDISQLSEAINEEIDDWSLKASLTFVDTLHEVAKDTKEKLEENTASPRREDKNLKNSYLVTPKGKNSRTNAKYTKTLHSSEYRLAHLIESGHKVYTRARGTKYVASAKKNGPLVITKVYPKDRRLAIPQAPDKTSKYEMWKKAREYAEKELYDRLVTNLQKIK